MQGPGRAPAREAGMDGPQTAGPRAAPPPAHPPALAAASRALQREVRGFWRLELLPCPSCPPMGPRVGQQNPPLCRSETPDRAPGLCRECPSLPASAWPHGPPSRTPPCGAPAWAQSGGPEFVSEQSRFYADRGRRTLNWTFQVQLGAPWPPSATLSARGMCLLSAFLPRGLSPPGQRLPLRLPGEPAPVSVHQAAQQARGGSHKDPRPWGGQLWEARATAWKSVSPEPGKPGAWPGGSGWTLSPSPAPHQTPSTGEEA